MSDKRTRAARRKQAGLGEKTLEWVISAAYKARMWPAKRREEASKWTKKEVKRRWRRATAGHIALSVGSFLLFLLITIYVGLGVVFLGPSAAASNKLTTTLMETSAMKFVPRLYFSAAEVQAILDANAVVETDEQTDVSLIVIPEATEAPAGAVADAEPEKDIEVFEVKGSTYKGFMMVVKDPSRVFVGVCSEGFSSYAGLKLDALAQRYDATAAINAGGFLDANGMGTGGTPLGMVVSQGKLMANNTVLEKHSTVIGFDQDDRLIIGKMTVNEAKEKGIRDAVSFGPALVVNGVGATITGQSSGFNPRTAIGQRADGAVLLLVIDGRQVNSMGASYEDLIKIMLEYGAINAANLDGGSSSLMYYEGEYLNEGFAIVGPREIPTAFVVQ